jgi:cell division protein FtsW (lipid II flippase)
MKMLLKTANRPLLTSDQIQSRLLLIGGTFLFIYSIVLSLSPAGRARSWDVEFRLSHWIGFGVWAIGIYLFHTQSRRWLPGRDPILFPIVALLSGWGLLTIWRLTPTFGIRQTIWLGLALAGSALGTRLPLHLNFLRRYKYLWLTSGLILTALTLFFGTNPSGFGPRQWLGCCGIYLQPSEPLKLLLIAYLAAYLADNHSRPISSGSRESLLPLLAPTFIMTGIALLLLLVQRDLGTATIFLFIYAAVVYIGSEKKRIIFATIASLAVVGIAGYRIFDVVRLRVDSWLNPWLDPTNRSYQIVQSLIAIASGEVIGRGPGMGNPALVPLTHSDFIFTAITEETGLLGALRRDWLIGSAWPNRTISIAAAQGFANRAQRARPLPELLSRGLNNVPGCPKRPNHWWKLAPAASNWSHTAFHFLWWFISFDNFLINIIPDNYQQFRTQSPLKWLVKSKSRIDLSRNSSSRVWGSSVVFRLVDNHTWTKPDLPIR